MVAVMAVFWAVVVPLALGLVLWVQCVEKKRWVQPEVRARMELMRERKERQRKDK